MRTRLFLSYLLIVLVTAAGIVLITGYRLRQDVGRFINRGGLSGTDRLVEELEAHYQDHMSWTGAETLIHGGPGAQMHAWGTGGEQPVILADANGMIIFMTMGQGNMGPGGPAFEMSPRSSDQLTEAEIALAVPLMVNNETIGYLLPEIPTRLPAGVESDLFSRLNRSAIWAAAAAASLSFFFALILAYFLLRPIRELTDAASEMATGDLTQRVEPRGGKETALLAATFNQMAESLQKAEARRKALTADVAHELRNPLAIQRANLEALQDGLFPLTLDTLEPLMQQNLQLEHLVEDLRTLALADAGQIRLEFTPTRLGDLLERRISDLKPEATAMQIEIRSVLSTDCPEVQADPARIGQIILNLLNNAIQYTPPGGWIEMALNCTNDSLAVRVRDTGPGIPEKDLDHIFERFFRGEESRERSSGSTGLGLSIAKRLAEAHHGTLTAANHPDGGAVFTLSLPVKSGEPD